MDKSHNQTLPLVSVIVPTYNSARTLEACLRSIQEQTYTRRELIIVDNNSSDATTDIARQYSGKVVIAGPERSAQRNIAASRAEGSILLFVDSDMVLARDTIEECVEAFNSDADTVALVIPEETVGKGYWAAVRRFERSFYQGVDWIEAARAFRAETFKEAGGYNEDLISGEDWDLANRAGRLGKTGRTESVIKHDESSVSLLKHLKKKYYYSTHLGKYKQSASQESRSQFNPFRRVFLFIKHPVRLITKPHLTLGLFVLKLLEFLVYLAAMVRLRFK